MRRTWRGQGPTFALEWGGRDWSLRVDGDTPGLADRPEHPTIWLAGLAARGRRDPAALSGATLGRHEHHLSRIEATYVPPDWGELTIRAAWGPFGDEGVDMEIEVSARSVGLLRAVEVLIGYDVGNAGPPGPRQVTPRDRHCAGLSYDGRESRLDELATLPIPEAGRPWPCWELGDSGPDQAAERRLLVMARPEDVSRRIVSPGKSTMLALFGHDLERGIVLRGRVRALWLSSGDAGTSAPEARARDAFAEFTSEPPPLTT